MYHETDQKTITLSIHKIKPLLNILNTLKSLNNHIKIKTHIISLNPQKEIKKVRKKNISVWMLEKILKEKFTFNKSFIFLSFRKIYRMYIYLF